jgi:hypothetical protein
MDDLKPSILMGKLKQLLPHGVSPNNDLFLSVFLTRLLPSMREAVGSGEHKTVVAMVCATDALWDAHGGHNPTAAAAMTHRCRSPAPAERKKNYKRGGSICSKSLISPLKTFTVFKTQATACVNTTITTMQGPTSV